MDNQNNPNSTTNPLPDQVPGSFQPPFPAPPPAQDLGSASSPGTNVPISDWPSSVHQSASPIPEPSAIPAITPESANTTVANSFPAPATDLTSAWPNDPMQTLPPASTPQPTANPWQNSAPDLESMTNPAPANNQSADWPPPPNSWSPPPASELAPNDEQPTAQQRVENTTSPWSDAPSATDITQQDPVSATPDITSTWTPPISSAPTVEPTQSVPPQSAAASEPMPTFTPPPDQSSTSPFSPLDNPLGAPTQPPPIDSNPVQPSWGGTTNGNPAGDQSPTASMGPADSIPTDLSHLLTTNTPGEPTQLTPETLVMPTAAPTPEVQTLPTGIHKGGIPKWLIGVAAGLLLIVAGASAYFILGIGQPAKTVSIPAATSAPKPTSVPTIAPTTIPSEQPAASGSANFGQLQPSNPPQATSAAELLRRRQQ